MAESATGVVGEILRMHRSLPARPAVDEIEAALAVVQTVENSKSEMLQALLAQPKPEGVADELYAILQQMHRNLIDMRTREEKREALTLLELEDRHRLFDFLLQKALAALSLPSPQVSLSVERNDYVMGAPFSVTNSLQIMDDSGDFLPKQPNRVEYKGVGELAGGPKYSKDDSFMLKPRANAGLANLDRRPYYIKHSANQTGEYAGGSEKLALVKLAGLIETAAKEDEQNLDLRGRLIDQVKWLPDSIGKLGSLVELDVSENRIVALPDSIQGLSKLRKLGLHANLLQKLPDSIGKLCSLTSLDLHGNCLTALPPSIGDLSKLVCLDLSANQLFSLPESIGRLSNLERLNIETNEIEEVPYTIGQCVSLIELRADFNRLKALPEAVGKLESLQVLTLHYNKIKSLPSTMAHLSNLKQLDVSFNELESIPESLCLATGLVKLNISNNFADLQRLPRSIGNLGMLEELDISNNQIRVLPDSFAMLTNLRILNAEQTPLEMPPRYIAERGAQAVVQYMNEHDAKRDENCKIAKPKGRWSKLYSCLKKRTWEETNREYIKAGV